MSGRSSACLASYLRQMPLGRRPIGARSARMMAGIIVRLCTGTAMRSARRRTPRSWASRWTMSSRWMNGLCESSRAGRSRITRTISRGSGRSCLLTRRGSRWRAKCAIRLRRRGRSSRRVRSPATACRHPKRRTAPLRRSRNSRLPWRRAGRFIIFAAADTSSDLRGG